MEERKARVQQLKSKTQCRKCGQTGRWPNDATASLQEDLLPLCVHHLPPLVHPSPSKVAKLARVISHKTVRCAFHISSTMSMTRQTTPLSAPDRRG